LVGPASIRLVAPTGTKNVAILQVKRADGRDPTKLEGAPAPPAEGQNPVNSPPAIVSVPSTRSVARGGTTTLFVSASGENLTYQWKMNGQNIAGATSSALPLENATGADAGQYVVNVTNPNGSVSSQAITVTVKMPVVPAGVYRINNSAGNAGHEVSLTSFSIDQHEVTKAFWDEVYTWAIANGYDFSNAGIAEGPEYPVHSINWYDSIKWANALSERDGHTPCYYTDNNCTVIYRAGQVDLTNYNVKWNANGYRLPTETEWEVAARGGLVGSKYAWGESPSTTRANFDQTLHGATIPVGSFPANGYGLYEIGGNLREWTWDWNDSETYQYDLKEITSINANGFRSFIDISETNSTWGWHVIDPSQISSRVYARIKTVTFEKPTIVSVIRNQIKTNGGNTGRCFIKFYFSDGTTLNSDENFVSGDYIDAIYTNPKPFDYLEKFEVYLANSNSGYYVYEKDTSLRAYIANTNGTVNSIVLSLPDYKENDPSSFALNYTAEREQGDLIWFELVGDNNVSKTYAETDFGKLLPIPVEVPRPKKVRIMLKATPSNPTPGGTALRQVFWTTSNPKSHWTGTERVIRDNHYAEALENLGKRTFSTPDRRYSTVGFRLVQRP
jgi:formylglycine-generating enzyme required for sulfatase activity